MYTYTNITQSSRIVRPRKNEVGMDKYCYVLITSTNWMMGSNGICLKFLAKNYNNLNYFTPCLKSYNGTPRI
jgi:hypothetical protein